MKIKLLFGALLIFVASALSYPKISSTDWCQPKHLKSTVSFCATKPDSLREGEICFSANSLKDENVFSGMIRPDKNGIKYRTLKPECADLEMIRVPVSEIQMR